MRLVRRLIEQILEFFTELYRPFYHNGLPPEYSLDEIQYWNFARGGMSRAARLNRNEKSYIPYHIFGVIGTNFVRRALRAWWPHERLLMEDVSLAFFPIYQLTGTGKYIPQYFRDRLVMVLRRYLHYVGAKWSDDQIRAALEKYITDDAEDFAKNGPHRG